VQGEFESRERGLNSVPNNVLRSESRYGERTL
jgi:hypothetical protein